MRRSERVTYAFLYVTVAVFVFYSLFPIFYMVITSIKSYMDLYASPPRFFAFEATLENYRELYREGAQSYFLNSVVIASAATFLTLFFGSLMAFNFAKHRFWGKKALFFMIIVTRAYPPVTTLIPIYLMVRSMGLYDTRVGLIVVYASLQMSLVVWVMRSFFASIPKETMESALVDGASITTLFFRIALPLTVPGLVASGILVWVLYWNEFLMALILTSTNVSKTIPVALSSFLVSEQKAHWGTLSAFGLIGIVPILVIVAVASKHFVKGIMAGSVKE
ncbi:MAG: carbohydrate ABC transporter permease [Planctomycetes bacterium]|nr:carbohydrate ABC transporter permease [Planctomycetota bacterium]